MDWTSYRERQFVEKWTGAQTRTYGLEFGLSVSLLGDLLLNPLTASYLAGAAK